MDCHGAGADLPSHLNHALADFIRSEVASFGKDVGNVLAAAIYLGFRHFIQAFPGLFALGEPLFDSQLGELKIFFC